MIRSFFCFIFLCNFLSLPGQHQPIILNNASLEDMPAHSHPPIGWYDCGDAGKSPVDVHPSNVFLVTHLPYQGQSYVGMVTRDDGTYEKFGQQLPQAMQAGVRYQLNVQLARAPKYVSGSPTTMRPTNYHTPSRLRIWGGFTNCHSVQLLAESKPVVHEEWKTYTFTLKPQKSYTHILFEVFYANERDYNTCGHVLIDAISPLLPIASDSDELQELPTLSYAYQDTSTLADIVRTCGPRIKTNNSFLFYEKKVFQDKEGKRWVANPNLWQIGYALAQNLDQQLIIMLDEDDNKIFYNKYTDIQETFSDFGLIENEDYVIEKWRRKHRKKDWLWPIPNRGLTMRVEQY